MNTTMVFILLSVSAFVISWVIFDFVIIAKKGKYESISAHIIRLSREFPMIPFVVGIFLGFVCGHLFWQMLPGDVYNDLKCELVTHGLRE